MHIKAKIKWFDNTKNVLVCIYCIYYNLEPEYNPSDKGMRCQHPQPFPVRDREEVVSSISECKKDPHP